MVRLLWSNEDGIILPFAVLMIAVFTILGFSALFLVHTQAVLEQKEINRTDALHYAEAGINDYLGHLNRRINVPWDKWGAPIPFEDGYYQLTPVNVEDNSLVRVIRSTGWVAGDEQNKRTIEVEIDRRAFNQYAYFSGTDCYIYGGKKEPVYWAKNEKCYGPYHTNDILYIKDAASEQRPVFYGPVTYVNGVQGTKDSVTVWIGPFPISVLKDFSNLLFKKGHSQVPAIEVPRNNYQLKEKAMERGHYYFGQTRIRLDGDQYHVKYYVKENGKYKPVVETKRLPDNGVIYVDGGSGGKFDYDSGNVFISGTLSGQLTIGAANEIYITGYDPTIDEWQVAQQHPTGGITYENVVFYAVDENHNKTTDPNKIAGYKADTKRGNDMLGLVANKDIKILGIGWFNKPNPRSSDKEYNVAPQNIYIHAALFSI